MSGDVQDEKPPAPPRKKAEEIRPQQAGEAETTRFGMEEGDNTDVPATGGSHQDEDQS